MNERSRTRRRIAGQGTGVTQGGAGGAAGGPAGAPADSGGLGEWIRSLVLAVVLFLGIRTFIVGTFVITSGSMEHTLEVGDFLVVDRTSVGARIPFTRAHLPGWSEPRLGDVIVFDPPHEPDLKLVKRLVGMPGDTLEMRGGTLIRNGLPQEEPFVERRDPGGNDSHPWMEWQRDHLHPSVDRATYRPTRDDWGPLVIPAEHYFMLGDNRDESLDSRYWGLLEAWRVEGRASFIYFSYNRGSPRPFPFIREVRWERIFDGIE